MGLVKKSEIVTPEIMIDYVKSGDNDNNDEVLKSMVR
jgi:hypothetical protein